MDTLRRHTLGKAVVTSAGLHVLALGLLVGAAIRVQPSAALSSLEVVDLRALDETEAQALYGSPPAPLPVATPLPAPPPALPTMEMAPAAAVPRAPRLPAGEPGEAAPRDEQGAHSMARGPGGPAPASEDVRAPAAALASIGISADEAEEPIEDTRPAPRGEPGATGASTPPALATYLAALATRVRSHWHPSAVYGQAQADSAAAATDARQLLAESPVESRASTLRVELRADGSLGQIAVAESSGHVPLDEEAVAAFERAQPFAPPAPALLDARGGLRFEFSLRLDLKNAAYLARLGQHLGALWAPSPAVRRFEGFDRLTVVRAQLADDGVVTGAAVLAPSGLDLLDASALATLRAGTRLPAPPPGLRRPRGGRSAGTSLRITFVYRGRAAGVVRADADGKEMAAVADNASPR